MKVFLTGFMGSGKTTIGKKLANYLKYEFIDLDKRIEADTGMNIVSYFTIHGEEAFREKEREILQQTTYPENVIVATGGGAPCYGDNMDWMNAMGMVVYLSLSPGTLASRLGHSTADRPLIRGLSGGDLIAFIASKLEQRETYYNKAQFIISGEGLTARKLAFYLGLGQGEKE